MAKSAITERLEKDIIRATRKIGTFGCLEVTIGIGGKERVDYMTLDTKGIWRCYEVKCSLSDFRSKAAKSFCGHYNYYVLTPELYEKVKDEIPKDIGVYVNRTLTKRPARRELPVDDDVLKLSFIRSLSRDVEKYYKLSDVREIDSFNRRIKNLESERDSSRKYERYLQEKLRVKFGYAWREEIEKW